MTTNENFGNVFNEETKSQIIYFKYVNFSNNLKFRYKYRTFNYCNLLQLMQLKSTLHYIRANMIKLKNSMLCNKVRKSANFSRVRNTSFDMDCLF
jgi:hypothetical protein